MPTTIRQQIADKIVAKLLTIPGIGEVSKEPRHPLSLQAFPAITFAKYMDEPERGASSVHRRTWTLSLLCWVYPHLNLFDTLEALSFEITSRMNKELWSGLANDTRELATMAPFLDAEVEQAGILIDFEIDYRTSATDNTAPPS